MVGPGCLDQRIPLLSSGRARDVATHADEQMLMLVPVPVAGADAILPPDEVGSIAEATQPHDIDRDCEMWRRRPHEEDAIISRALESIFGALDDLLGGVRISARR